MADEYELMFEPLPGGWKYGFPRALPQEAVMGKGADLWINPGFDTVKWVASFGFPEDQIYKWKTWPEKIKDEAAEKMGDLKFTTAGDYIYPGSDCQQ